MDGVGAEGGEAQSEGEGEAGADEAEGWGGEGLGEVRTETRRDWEVPPPLVLSGHAASLTPY